MRKVVVVLFTLLSACFFFNAALAQEKQKAKVSLIRQSGSTVTMTVTSSGEFYIGGNTHVLHIGTKHFDRCDQDNVNGKGILKFHIPSGEFKTLKNGTKMYLSYGQLDMEDEQQLDALSKEREARVWALGKLNKKMLK